MAYGDRGPITAQWGSYGEQPGGAPRAAPARQPAAAPAQQAQQQPQQQGDGGLMDFLARLGVTKAMAPVWGQQAYAGGLMGAANQQALGNQAVARQQGISADNTARAGMQNVQTQSDAAIQQQQIASNAAMHAANQQMQASSFGPQASVINTPINAVAGMNQAYYGPASQQNIGVMQAESQRYAADLQQQRFAQIMGMMGPAMQGLGQGAPTPMGISTDFGGGVSYG